jgi:ribosomal protein S27E
MWQCQGCEDRDVRFERSIEKVEDVLLGWRHSQSLEEQDLGFHNGKPRPCAPDGKSIDQGRHAAECQGCEDRDVRFERSIEKVEDVLLGWRRMQIGMIRRKRLPSTLIMPICIRRQPNNTSSTFSMLLSNLTIQCQIDK